MRMSELPQPSFRYSYPVMIDTLESSFAGGVANDAVRAHDLHRRASAFTCCQTISRTRSDIQLAARIVPGFTDASVSGPSSVLAFTAIFASLCSFKGV